MSIDYISAYIEAFFPFSLIAIIPSAVAMYMLRWLFFIFYVQLFGQKCKAKVINKNILTTTHSDSDGGTSTMHSYYMTVIYGKQYGDKYYFYTVAFRVRRWEYNDSEINSMINIKYLKWNCCWFSCKDNSIGYHHCHGVAWSTCCNIIKGTRHWIKVLVVFVVVVPTLYWIICMFSFNHDDTGQFRLVRGLFIVLNGWINMLLIRFIMGPLFCGLLCCKMQKYIKNPFGIIKPPHDQYQSVSKVRYDKFLRGVVEFGNLTRIIDLIDMKLEEELKKPNETNETNEI